MQAFAEAGVGPLHVMNRFCHDNEIEFFWSMRMNDTHDGQGADYVPVMLRANKLKKEYSEYLIGTEASKPRYGNWTAVDYGPGEVPEFGFRRGRTASVSDIATAFRCPPRSTNPASSKKASTT